MLTCISLSVGVKRSVCVRLAETPVCLWRECVPSAAPTAALVPVLLHPTHSNPAPLSHRARDLTGSCQWMCFLMSK